MTRSRAVAVAIFLGMLGGTALSAQGYPGGGGMGGGGMGMGGGGRHGGRGGSHQNGGGVDPKIAAAARSYNPDDPIALALASRADLKLADSQVVTLDGIEGRLLSADGPIRARLDSLRPPGDSAKPVDWSNITPDQRDSIIQVRKAVAEATGAIHDNVLKARTDLLAALSPDQQQQFSDLERKVVSAINSGALNRHPPGGRPSA